MNAAVIERPAPHSPVQLGFLDAPAEAPRLRLAVIGMLYRPAEVRISGDGRIHLFVEVVQPKGGLPFIAMCHADADARPELERLAAHLQAGVAVLIRGETLALTHHHGADALELKRCNSISQVAFDQPQEGTAQ